MSGLPSPNQAGHPDIPPSRASETLEPPGDEIPTILPFSRFLYRSPDTVIVLESARIYSTGLAVEANWVHRRGDLTATEWTNWLQKMVKGVSGDVTRDGFAADGLRIDVEFPDGSRASSTSLPAPSMPPGQADGPILRLLGRSRSGGPEEASGHAIVWLSPLPPVGTVRLDLAWRELGIPDMVVELDGSALKGAADGVQKYWNR